MGFITFQCYACRQALKAGDDKAGRKVKCYKCGSLLTVPVASTVPSGPPPTATRVPPPVPLPASPPQTPVPPLAAELVEPGPLSARAAKPPEPELADYADDRDDFDDRPRPRRRRRHVDEDDYDDEWDDRPRPKGSQALRWQKVRLGLLLVFIGACVYAGGYGLEQVAVLIQHLSSFSQPRTLEGFQSVGQVFDASRVIYRLGLVVLFGGTVTAIVGYVFCLFTPNRFGSLGLAIATLATAAAGALLMVPYRLAGRPYLWGSVGPFDYSLFSSFLFGPSEQLFMIHLSPGSFIVSLIVDGCALTPFILFPLYLRALARARRDRALADDCMRLMTYSCCAVGFSLLWPLLSLPFLGSGLEGARVAGWVMWILHYINVGLFVGMLVWFLRTLSQAREAFER
jgi:hypothetical protein